MNDPFTMAEYIRENKLGVSLHDSGSTRMIAEHLINKGYVKKRVRIEGHFRNVWTKKVTDRTDLKRKLEGL